MARRKKSTALFTFQKGKKARKPFKFKPVSITGTLKPIGEKVKKRRVKRERDVREKEQTISLLEEIAAKKRKKREKALRKFIRQQRRRTKIKFPTRRI